ncbi:hypothetical protein PQX77_010388 [Marasmius sp. AFHP31]|nr:hypothetical protein PQX77_010388 [Marasmius sp. AFHP31]
MAASPDFAQLPEDDEDMSELSGEELAEHFQDVTVGGRDRLYHSSQTAPYPFPVDTPEQKRVKKEHELLKRLLGDAFLGRIDHVLNTVPPGPQVVVDFGTGPGQWRVLLSAFD